MELEEELEGIRWDITGLGEVRRRENSLKSSRAGIISTTLECKIKVRLEWDS
jgi:hypothetical protein